MNIDWFQIIFIIINFFVLLFILQKIFYKPVIKIMAERQQRIDDSLSSAENKKKEAENLITTYEDKLKSIEKTKESLLSEAREEAKEKKEKWLIDYQVEANEKRHHYFNEIEEEKETLSSALQEQIVLGAVSVASRLLEETKNEDWDERLFSALLEKLNSYEFEESLDELSRGDSSLVLRSARLMDEEKKKTLENILKKSPFRNDPLTYEKDPTLHLGYELQLPSHTVYASVGNYLENSQEKLMALLDGTSYDEVN